MDARHMKTIQKKKSAELKKRAIFSTTWAVFHPDRFLTGLKIWPDLYPTEYLSNFPPYMQLSMHSWVK